jgi:protoheme IX farnesyltransferase
MTQNVLRRLLTAALLSGIAAVITGVVVSTTGAGAVCRAWPICFDVLTADAAPAAWLAMLHRLFVLISAAGTTVAAFAVLRRSTDRLLRGSLLFAIVTLISQALLGALPAEASAAVIRDLTHLSGGLLSLGSLTVATAAAWFPQTAGRLAERRRRLIDVSWWFAAAGFGAVLVNGARGLPELSTQVQSFLPVNAFGSTLFTAVVGTAAVLRMRAVPGITPLMRSTALTGVVAAVSALSVQALPIGDELIRAAAMGGTVLSWLAALMLTVMLQRAPAGAAAAPVAAAAKAAGAGWRQVLDDYISLTKPKVISLLLVTTLAAMFLTEAGMPGWWLIFWTMVGGYLAAGGAGAINCAFDSDIDVNMGRTSRRPVPSGRISARAAMIFGLVLSALSLVVLAVFTTPAAAIAAFTGIVYYAYFYTSLLKRSTWQNIIIGGGAGAIPPLVGWTAVTGSVSLAAVVLFAIIFYWTPPHFWALALVKRQDYARAGVPMLPVVAGDGETRYQIFVYSVLLIAVTVLPTAIGSLGWIYLVGALLLGVKFLQDAWAVWRVGDQAAIWGLYKYSLLYLALLFAVMVADRLLLG